MTGWTRTLCLGLTLTCLPAQALANRSGLVFRAPPGWSEMSPETLEGALGKFAPQLIEQVRDGTFDFFAIEQRDAAGDFAENVNVTLDEGRLRVTDAALRELQETMVRQVTGLGGDYVPVDRRIVEIEGVPCGRLVGRMTVQHIRMKQVAYVLPARDFVATATYSTTLDDFATYEPIFDAAAMATRGVVEHRSFLANVLGGATRGAVIGALLGAGVSVVVWLGRKFRAKARS